MDTHQRIVEAFQIEHKEQTEGIRALLSSMAGAAVSPDDARWTEAFRMAHTLKGGARVCGFRGVEAIGHRMESLFAKVREGTLAFDRHVDETLARALDEIEDQMIALKGQSTPPIPTQRLAEIDRLLGNVEPIPSLDVRTDTEAATTNAASARVSPEIDTLRIQASRLDDVLVACDALYTVGADLDDLSGELAKLHALVRELYDECEGVRAVSSSTMRRLGADQDLDRTLQHAEAVSQHVQNIMRVERMVRRVHERGVWSLGMVSSNIRRAVQETRMVTAENIFHGLRTMVRNLSRDEGKEVEFRVTGLDVQADRMVLQALKDPLIHALRNAVVHGIESPGRRTTSGKDAVGRISLSLETHGKRLHVRVEDDGAGIDLEQVSREAVRRGLLAEESTPNQPQRDEAALRFLFKPGFSTAKQVSELAGRGMGLSVVQETVARLRGDVRIDGRLGTGAILDIWVPLTVSAERLLLVSCAESVFALPTHALDRVIRLSSADVRTVDGVEIGHVDGIPMTLIRLHQVMGLPVLKAARAQRSQLAVVLRSETQRVGLLVDDALAEREALMRQIHGPAGGVRLFNSAILLESNRVVLVIDPGVILDNSYSAKTVAETTSLSGPPKPASILIVDDSFTTRTLEKSILEASGYDVRVAVDGVEALKVLRSEAIGVIVADVQMPRMDGLALLQAVRSDERLKSLPYILVTSLDRVEDKKRGLDLGADAYIVKRQFDQNVLLETIHRFL